MRYRLVRRHVGLCRWGVQDRDSIRGDLIVMTFLTRWGAERWIRSRTWDRV